MVALYVAFEMVKYNKEETPPEPALTLSARQLARTLQYRAKHAHKSFIEPCACAQAGIITRTTMV